MNKTEFLSLDHKARQKIADKIKKLLYSEKEIVFAYIFGSFLDSPSFRDIDVGIYVECASREEIFNREMEMSKKIATECDLPVDFIDAKIINFAPSHFLNNIFKNGVILFSKNDKFLADMIEKTSLDAIANEYFSFQSLKELVPK